MRDDEVGIETLQVSKKRRKRGILKVEIETEIKDFE